MPVIRSTLCKTFKDGIKLGIKHPGIDALMTKYITTLAMRYIDNKCISGHGAWDRDCFLRHLIHKPNSIKFYRRD